MLSKIVRFSLQFKGIIISLSILLLGFGIYTLSRAKYDVFPEFAPPQVAIQTEALGLSPEQVEQLVTRPIENAINGVEGIESLRSGSIQGLSLVTVIFDKKSDIYRDRQLLSERLAPLASQLPQGIKPPVMTALTSSTGDLMTLGLLCDEMSLMKLRTIADWTVKQRLLAVPGVASVGVFGGEVRQLQIQVHPERLVQYNLSMDDVLASARRATGVRGGGFIDTDNQRITLQTEGQSLNPEELSKIIVLVQQNGLNVRLGDVANVLDAPAPPISMASITGHPGVILQLWCQYGANTLEVTRRVEEALEELRPALEKQKIVLHPDLFRSAKFIETATHNIKISLILGAILVIIVLFIFLFNFRTAAISCLAIPLSLLTAIAVLEHFGQSLNTMTLGGLAIAIGEVVDDAVIDVENILRRLRENSKLSNPRPAIEVVFSASIEVRSAVVYATFAVALIFVPVLNMSGLAGRLFAPLGIAYITAILASLVVALTITPALCLMLLREKQFREQSPVSLWLKEKYHGLLQGVEQHSKRIIFTVIVFTALGLSVLPFLRGEFLPELREGHFVIHMTAIPGTSLEESLRLGRQVTLELLKIPYVRKVAQRVGRATTDDTFGTHSSELEVDLKSLTEKQSDNAQSEIRDALSQFPEVTFSVNTFLTERIEETISGYRAPVVVNIFGNDLDQIDKMAQEVVKQLEKVHGATDIEMQSPPGTPLLAIRLRKEKLAEWGFDPVDILEVIRTAYQGNVVGQIYDKDSVFDVSVILDPSIRRSISDIENLPLRNPTGTYVRLKELAEISESQGRYEILHEGAQRVQTITCNVTKRNVNSFVKEAKKQIDSSIALPPGTYIEFTGTAEAEARSRQDLLMFSIGAGIGIIMLLSIVMKNSRNLLLVLTNLPFAMVGGVLAVLFSRHSLSIGALVGFVTLFGITVRNSIMLISHYDHLVVNEGIEWGAKAALEGATDRLIPILMTALVTGLGLLPLALASGTAGREIEGPMAIVILGGLITSTALNLLVLPTLALRFGKFGERVNIV